MPTGLDKAVRVEYTDGEKKALIQAEHRRAETEEEYYFGIFGRCGICHEVLLPGGSHACGSCGKHVTDGVFGGEIGVRGRYWNSQRADGWIVECWACWRQNHPKPKPEITPPVKGPFDK